MRHKYINFISFKPQIPIHCTDLKWSRIVFKEDAMY